MYGAPLANLYHRHGDYAAEVRVLEEAVSVFWQWPNQARRFEKLLARAEHYCDEYPDREPDPIVDKELEEGAPPSSPSKNRFQRAPCPAGGFPCARWHCCVFSTWAVCGCRR